MACIYQTDHEMDVSAGPCY